MIDDAVEKMAPLVGRDAALTAVGVDRATWYRRHRKSPKLARPERMATPQPRALSPVERKQIRALLESDEFVDEAPATVYAKLLDQGIYLGSVSTMYRILHEHDEVRERRRQATHPAHKKPELIATTPNSVWSWDITKLHGPAKWTYYYLYVILDIYSRYAVGWMLARVERAELSKRLITDTIVKQGVAKDQLTLHSDRGSPMIAKPVAHLLADLGVTKSHSRPHVSNDNPYSESQFRTFKYRPDFPDRFGSFEDAAPTVPDSSAGTTTTTGIRASACTLRLMSTTAGPKRSEIDVEWSSWTLTPSTPSGSFANPRPHRPSRPSCGSTNRKRRLPSH